MKNPLANVFSHNRRRSNLFPTFRDLENEMERYMGRSPFFADWPEEYRSFDFAPTCNMKENDREYTLEFDIPGIDKNDIKIEVVDNRITISGERKISSEGKDDKHYLSETNYGSFMRSFHLPTAIDENKVDATYEDGVLQVKVPKSESSHSRKIKVH